MAVSIQFLHYKKLKQAVPWSKWMKMEKRRNFFEATKTSILEVCGFDTWPVKEIFFYPGENQEFSQLKPILQIEIKLIKNEL